MNKQKSMLLTAFFCCCFSQPSMDFIVHPFCVVLPLDRTLIPQGKRTWHMTMCSVCSPKLHCSSWSNKTCLLALFFQIHSEGLTKNQIHWWMQWFLHFFSSIVFRVAKEMMCSNHIQIQTGVGLRQQHPFSSPDSWKTNISFCLECCSNVFILDKSITQSSNQLRCNLLFLFHLKNEA